jgi:hypothetical protein
MKKLLAFILTVSALSTASAQTVKEQAILLLAATDLRTNHLIETDNNFRFDAAGPAILGSGAVGFLAIASKKNGNVGSVLSSFAGVSFSISSSMSPADAEVAAAAVDANLKIQMNYQAEVQKLETLVSDLLLLPLQTSKQIVGNAIKAKENAIKASNQSPSVPLTITLVDIIKAAVNMDLVDKSALTHISTAMDWADKNDANLDVISDEAIMAALTDLMSLNSGDLYDGPSKEVKSQMVNDIKERAAVLLRSYELNASSLD